MADTTYRDMTEEHLGDMATSDDLKAFVTACEAYQRATGYSDSEATEYVWNDGDWWQRALYPIRSTDWIREGGFIFKKARGE